MRIGPRAERVWATTLAVVALLAAAGALARAGGPGRLVGRANDAFRAPIAKPSGDLNGRLLSFSGNGRSDYWRVAWHEARAHPLLGGGAGSYERHWFRERPNAFVTRDAHNLYLETLAELGSPGLALLLVALALPLTTLRRARHVPLATAAAAAYAAFLVHAALDWDWEVPAATLPALVCGWSLLVWTRPEGASRPLTTRVRAPVAAGALAVAAGILVLHVGNVALAKSSAAAGSGDARRADSEARRARAWAPWSAQPWQALAVAQLAEGRRGAARSSLREAIERDGSNWELWYGLAVASSGPERRRALDRVTRLNPRSPEADQLRTTR